MYRRSIRAQSFVTKNKCLAKFHVRNLYLSFISSFYLFVNTNDLITKMHKVFRR
jgi:hypothetical protein